MWRRVSAPAKLDGRAVRRLSALSRTWWGHVEAGPKDPIMGITEAFLADKAADKINLGVGAYRDDEGRAVVLRCVQSAQRYILERNMNNEYAPISGVPSFVKLSVDFCYGANAEPIKNNCFAAIQSLSGTGALRVMGEFIARFKPMDVYVPNPTWQNHVPIFSDCGLKVHKYRYYDTASKRLNFLGMLEDVNNAPSGSCILLHAAAHNPTGLDPSIEQWRELSRLVKTKNHFVIFDNAYQGYVSGDPVRDAESIALFVRDGHQLAVAQSYAKNFGLYGQRVGCLSILVDSPDVASRVESQLKILVRPMYSSPPLHGARIVATILEDPRLRQLWQEEVKGMADRIRSMREKLVDRLSAVGSKHDWSHIVQQNGMFCFSGLTPDQVAALAKNHSVYLTLNGRISMAGVTSKNVEKLAVAVHDVTKN